MEGGREGGREESGRVYVYVECIGGRGMRWLSGINQVRVIKQEMEEI